MKNLVKSGVAFVRENSGIIYSLILLGFIPAAFFFNTYSITSRMSDDIDRVTRSKAVLSEKIINTIAAEKVSNINALQDFVDDVASGNGEILALSILFPEEHDGKFRVVASNESEAIGKTTEDIQYILAWNKPEGIAFLDEDEHGRFWRVTKILSAPSGEKTGLVTMSLPLRDSDMLIERSINYSYAVLVITVLLVILMVSNQARLFGSVLAFNKLKEVDAMKDNLVSMASHELRSPLTAIKGYLELLRDKKLDLDTESSKYFENISSSVDRLNALVNDMLVVSRLEGNRIPLNITAFDPSSVITQSVEELRSQAIQKKLELRLEDMAPVVVQADTDRVREILINLIGNAIKYTPKGEVSVSAREKDGEYLITVADTGFGISSEDQARLFQKFNRIQNENTKGIIGTGLGLWITLELARKMNGNITVESIEGVGSHFTLHLPIAKK